MKYRAIGVALFFALLPAQAFAASRVWISEYASLSATNAPIAPLPALVIQPTLDITSSAQTSALFNSGARYIRIICEIQCAVRGDGLTATTSSILMPALSPEYFGVQPGKTVSVIASP